MEERRSAVGLARPLPAIDDQTQAIKRGRKKKCSHQRCRVQIREQLRRSRRPDNKIMSLQVGEIYSGVATDLADVARGSKPQTANETSAHVGEDITVKVGHDHDPVVIRLGVSRDLFNYNPREQRPTTRGKIGACLQADAV